MDIQHIITDLAAAGLIRDPASALASPLTGGVSSDIHLIRHADGSLVIKRALAQLRVKDEWLADVSRNDIEQKYMRYVSGLLPGAVPAILHANESLGYFAMEYLEGEWRTWKQMLFDGTFRVEDALAAGRLLGNVHAASHGSAMAASTFATDRNFFQLRLDAYLLATGRRHPTLRDRFEAEAARMGATHEALVHGDFSPKNILIGHGRMVLLDCEVAWYGDPVFDLGFLLNHLFLKTLFRWPARSDLAGMVTGFLAAYRAVHLRADHIELERRLVRLLPMLWLARVDGKSPAEYLGPRQQGFIRAHAPGLILRGPAGTPAELVAFWLDRLASLKI